MRFYLILCTFLILNGIHCSKDDEFNQNNAMLINEFLSNPDQVVADNNKLLNIARFISTSLKTSGDTKPTTTTTPTPAATTNSQSTKSSQKTDPAKTQADPKLNGAKNLPKGKTYVFNNMISQQQVFVQNNTELSNGFVQGNVKAIEQVTSDLYISRKSKVNTLRTDVIYNQNGGILIEGDLVLGNLVTGKPIDFKGSSFIIKDTVQWRLLDHQSFDDNENINQSGWDSHLLNKCEKDGETPNYFIGGHCKLSYNQVRKNFTKIPAHKQIRIQATFHMFDNWEGENAYMKFNDQIVWQKQGLKSKFESLDICGNTSYSDPHYNIKIDTIVNHTDEQFTLTFGSDLNKDPCEASYAIDDISIYLK